MDAIQEHIATFRRLTPDELGECYGKCAIVEGMEDNLADERVLSFFLEIVADIDEYDLARIAALKILQLWSAPSDDIHLRVGRELAHVIVSEQDVLVQQWAAIAAENFVDVPDVFAAVVSALGDRHADLDVRHNCLSAVENLRGSEQAKNALRQVVADTEMGANVRRILTEWSSH